MLPSQVRIRELGPREGFQTISSSIPTPQKIELIELLARSGVSEIEVTAFVRPDRVPQMADADAVVAALKPYQGVRYSALYLNQKGFERAQLAASLTVEAWLYTASSDTFLLKNSNLTREKEKSALQEWIGLFKAASLKDAHLMVSTAFGCGYEGPLPVSKIVEVVDPYVHALESAGMRLVELSVADTVGLAHPGLIEKSIELLRSRYPAVQLALHLHDTRGTGMANVYAGLCCGVDRFDASVGGVGGCPFTPGAAGNVCTEDVVYLCESLGVKTGIDLGLYVKAARLLEGMIATRLPGKYFRSVSV